MINIELLVLGSNTLNCLTVANRTISVELQYLKPFVCKQ